MTQVVRHVAAVAHHVVAEQVGRVVEVTHLQRHLPLLALPPQGEVVDVDHLGLARGDQAVDRVVPGDEEPRVGWPDARHDVAVDQHPLEHTGVGLEHLVALGERVTQVGQRDTEPLVHPGLPEERSAVEVDPAAVDAAGAGVTAQAKQALEAVGQRGHVVVHQPEPVVPVDEGLPDAGVEAARAAGVGVKAQHVHDRLVVVLLLEELLGPVRAGVVDDVDRVQRPGLRQQRRQQLGKEVLAVVRDDHGGHRPVLVGTHLLHLHP